MQTEVLHVFCNIRKYLYVFFFRFIINYVNDVIKTFIDSKKPPLFQKLDYQIKKNVNPKTKVIEVDGKSIKEAFDNLKNKVDKEIFMSHIDLLILDKNLNDKNIQEIIDYFIYNSEMRNDFLTIISNEINELLTNTKYDEIETFIKTNNYIRNIINISFEEIANNYLEKKDFFITSINYNNYFIYQNYYFHDNNLKELNNEEN